MRGLVLLLHQRHQMGPAATPLHQMLVRTQNDAMQCTASAMYSYDIWPQWASSLLCWARVQLGFSGVMDSTSRLTEVLLPTVESAPELSVVELIL